VAKVAPLSHSKSKVILQRYLTVERRRAPHAVYALVQTALVQDEALKRANARIEELQAQTAGESQQHGGFLDSVRDEVLGKRDPRGSVPSVRSQTQSSPTTAPPYPPGPVWHRAWARPLVRADRFSARPHPRQRA
jgi:hypothetical protein